MHAVAARARGSGGGTKLALQSGSSDGTTGVSPMHSSAPHPCTGSARAAPGAASARRAARNARSTMALMAPLLSVVTTGLPRGAARVIGGNPQGNRGFGVLTVDRRQAAVGHRAPGHEILL